MTNKTPTTEKVSGLPETNEAHSADAVRVRIAAFCKHFDNTAPKLRVRKGSVYLTDELLDWFNLSGASMDWILFGDALSMAGAYRGRITTDREFGPIVRGFDDAEQKMMLATLLVIAKNEVTLEDAMGAFKAAVEERRRAA